MKYGNLQLIILKIKQTQTRKSFISEKKLKDSKQNLNNEETKFQYNSFKDELNDIYEEISKNKKPLQLV